MLVTDASYKQAVALARRAKQAIPELSGAIAQMLVKLGGGAEVLIYEFIPEAGFGSSL